MTTETEVVSTLNKGDKGTIVADQTAFYATSGGQEADKGVIVSGDAAFEVEDVIKLSGGKFGHVGPVSYTHLDVYKRQVQTSHHPLHVVLQNILMKRIWECVCLMQ